MTTKFDLLKALFIGILVSAAFTSCAGTGKLPNGDSYAELAHRNGREPDPVIVIPGILGTRLIDSYHDRVVWGSFGVGSIWHGSAKGRRALALPMRMGKSLANLTDDVQPDGTLDRLTLGAGIGVEAYSRLLHALTIGGYRDERPRKSGSPEHVTCFEFGYDWRKSNAENAIALDDFIEEKRHLVDADYFRRHGSHKDVKFDIVAHSMGGLVARYYMMYGRQQPATDGKHNPVTWAGTRHVRRLIQVGTPNGGSAEAMVELKNGIKLSRLLPKFQPAVIGTFPSVYELLPRDADHPVVDESGNSVDIYDPAVWEKYGWGLADPQQSDYIRQLLPDVAEPTERRAIALDHIRKSLAAAKAFHTALDCNCQLPRELEMHTFHGEAIETPSQLRVSSNGELTIISKLPGDGTVTLRSALSEASDSTPGPIPWTSSHPIHASHISLPVQPEFIHSLLPLLLDLPESHTQP